MPARAGEARPRQQNEASFRDTSRIHARTREPVGTRPVSPMSSDVLVRAGMPPTPTALRQALERDAFELYYLPMVASRNGCTSRVEALLRWPTSDGHCVAPLHFLPVAETHGLIGQLTRWVIDHALNDWVRWRARNLAIGVNVNISPLDLDDDNLCEHLKQRLRQLDAPRGALSLEVPYAGIIARGDSVRDVIDGVRQTGVTLVLDNYACAYGPIALADMHPWKAIKLDRANVMGMCRSTADELQVRATTALAHQCGSEVIAQGAHSHREWEAARAIGCDLVQGFYLSPPQSSANLVRWLQRSTWRPAEHRSYGAQSQLARNQSRLA